jgi:hypothetical protein
MLRLTIWLPAAQLLTEGCRLDDDRLVDYLRDRAGPPSSHCTRSPNDGALA